MSRILDYLYSLFQPEAYNPGAILFELLLIGVVVYAVLRFLHGTRGARILQSITFLLIVGFLLVTVVAESFHLERIAVLYRPFVWTIFLTTLVVFQPELRRGLMRMSEARWRKERLGDAGPVIEPVAAACRQLSTNRIGALIAIERDISLSGITDQGIRVDARLTPELLNSIFWPGSALHDLGVVISRGRVAAAGCLFPLAEDEALDRSLGSRHRAAVGLSLESDAIVVVVSEETGTISIAEHGRLHRHIAPEALARTLRQFLTHDRNIADDWPGEEGTESSPRRKGPREAAAPAADDAGQTAGKRGRPAARKDQPQTLRREVEGPPAARAAVP